MTRLIVTFRNIANAPKKMSELARCVSLCLYFVPFVKTVILVHSNHTMLTTNPLNAELNPICHLLALLGAHHTLHVSRIRVNLNYI